MEPRQRQQMAGTRIGIGIANVVVHPASVAQRQRLHHAPYIIGKSSPCKESLQTANGLLSEADVNGRRAAVGMAYGVLRGYKYRTAHPTAVEVAGIVERKGVGELAWRFDDDVAQHQRVAPATRERAVGTIEVAIYTPPLHVE